MKRIVGEKVSELCVELCQRLGDEYDGPYMVTMDQKESGGGTWVLRFYGKRGTYEARETAAGLVIRDEGGNEIALYEDIVGLEF